MSSNEHVPVLLEPVLEGLNIKPDGIYVDGTFGRGGHSRRILDQLSEQGRLIALDRDPDAAAYAETFSDDPRFELVRSDFAQLGTSMGDRGLDGHIDGLLFDLGVSSPQLDNADRGFSFLRDGPLDMRMDPESGQSAADWLHTVDENTLKRVIKQLGEEPMAARIARAIVTARETARIETTGQLAQLVESVAHRPGQKRHAATKTFQAIRLWINQELEQLQSALEQSLDVMAHGGRLCVISFHSLEDRAVKRFMRDNALDAAPYRGLPNVPAEARAKLRLIGKAISANADEVDANRRSRSARLRIAERQR